MITKFKLYENPNYIYYKHKNGDKGFFWDETNNIVFSYYKTIHNDLKFYYADNDNTHQRLYNIADRNNEIKDDDAYIHNGRGKFSGRLFVNAKFISFWDFPKNQQELKFIANDIKENTGIDIYEQKYKIEVVKNESQIEDRWYNGETYFIPVEEYKSSKKRTEEELKQSHVKSPIEKQNKDEEYFKYQKDKPLKWKQALLKSENNNTI